MAENKIKHIRRLYIFHYKFPSSRFIPGILAEGMKRHSTQQQFIARKLCVISSLPWGGKWSGLCDVCISFHSNLRAFLLSLPYPNSLRVECVYFHVNWDMFKERRVALRCFSSPPISWSTSVRSTESQEIQPRLASNPCLLQRRCNQIKDAI